MRRDRIVGSRWGAAALAAVVVLTASACTIRVFEDAEDDAHQEGDHAEGSGGEEDHDHPEGSGGEEDHDHPEESGGEEDHDHPEDEVGVDHHGNPIYDENERVYEQLVEDGLSVEFTVENFIGVGGRGGEMAPRLVEGEHATLQFHVTDTTTGEPVGGLRPAVWLDVVGEDDECASRVEGYLSGNLDRRPVMDLNSYFVLGMNQENSISVIDPMVDVGGMTNLFALVLLQGRPEDWAISTDSSRLFVTMPEIGRIAVVDLDAFLVEESVEVPGEPVRVATEPGGRSVWATLGDQGGVAVVDVTTLTVDVVDTDGPTYELAFSPDGTTAVIGTGDGVLIVDLATRVQTGHVRLAGEPTAFAISPADGDAYVAQQSPGLVSVVDLGTAQEVARLRTDPGVADIGVSIDGRWAVAASADAETAYVIDTSTSRITHVFPVAGVPDQVLFSETAAYIHNGANPSITVVPLADLEPSGEISVLTVPVGSASRRFEGADAVADAVVRTPDGRALLIADPDGDTVHFYTEGSEAALGGFQGHTLRPRAVQIVDRSMKEPAEGVYTASIRIPQGGDFVVAFVLDDPSIVHCFEFGARSADTPLAEADSLGARIELNGEQEFTVGRQDELEFVVRDGATGEPIDALDDVVVMLIHAGGRSSSQVLAPEQPNGSYAAPFTPWDVGTYTVLVAVPSLGMTFQTIRPVSIQVSAS